MAGMLDLRDIAPIIKQFAKQGARQLWYRVTVIHIAHRDFVLSAIPPGHQWPGAAWIHQTNPR